MTVIQCSNPTVKRQIIEIMTKEFGLMAHSAQSQMDELKNKIITNFSFIDHLQKYRGPGATSVSDFPLTVFKLLFGASDKQINGVLTKSWPGMIILDKIQSELKSAPYIKYTLNDHEFKDSLCETMCYALNNLNELLLKPITYNELHAQIYLELSVDWEINIFNNLRTFLMSNYGFKAGDNIGTIAVNMYNAITPAFRDTTFNSFVDQATHSYNTAMMNFITKRVQPLIYGYSINAFETSFNNGVLGSKIKVQPNKTIFDTNNADVIIHGISGDYKINGRVILVIQSSDYNEKYNIMRWCDGLTDDNVHKYIFNDKIEQHLKANADRYSTTAIERTRRELNEIYHKSYTEEDIRTILFPTRMRSLYPDFLVPLKYADETNACGRYHVACDGTNTNSHIHEGETTCTRCKYMRLKYDQMNVYVIVYNPSDSVEALKESLRNSVRDIILYANDTL